MNEYTVAELLDIRIILRQMQQRMPYHDAHVMDTVNRNLSIANDALSSYDKTVEQKREQYAETHPEHGRVFVGVEGNKLVRDEQGTLHYLEGVDIGKPYISTADKTEEIRVEGRTMSVAQYKQRGTRLSFVSVEEFEAEVASLHEKTRTVEFETVSRTRILDNDMVDVDAARGIDLSVVQFMFSDVETDVDSPQTKDVEEEHA